MFDVFRKDVYVKDLVAYSILWKDLYDIELTNETDNIQHSVVSYGQVMKIDDKGAHIADLNGDNKTKIILKPYQITKIMVT